MTALSPEAGPRPFATVFVVEASSDSNDAMIAGVAASLAGAQLVAQGEADTYETGPLAWSGDAAAAIWTAAAPGVVLTITEYPLAP